MIPLASPGRSSRVGSFNRYNFLVIRRTVRGFPLKYLADASGDFQVPRKSTICRSIPFNIFHVLPPILSAYGATVVVEP